MHGCKDRQMENIQWFRYKYRLKYRCMVVKMDRWIDRFTPAGSEAIIDICI